MPRLVCWVGIFAALASAVGALALLALAAVGFALGMPLWRAARDAADVLVALGVAAALVALLGVALEARSRRRR